MKFNTDIYTCAGSKWKLNVDEFGQTCHDTNKGVRVIYYELSQSDVL